MIMVHDPEGNQGPGAGKFGGAHHFFFFPKWGQVKPGFIPRGKFGPKKKGEKALGRMLAINPLLVRGQSGNPPGAALSGPCVLGEKNGGGGGVGKKKNAPGGEKETPGGGCKKRNFFVRGPGKERREGKTHEGRRSMPRQ